MTLRVGDILDFVITATDPFGEPLNYAIIAKDRDRLWEHSNHQSWQVAPDQVGKDVHAILLISSNREHHAYDFHDDEIVFTYDRYAAQALRDQTVQQSIMVAMPSRETPTRQG